MHIGDDFGGCGGAAGGGVWGGGGGDVDFAVGVREEGRDVCLVLGVRVVGVGAGFFDRAVGAVVEGWFGHDFFLTPFSFPFLFVFGLCGW